MSAKRGFLILLMLQIVAFSLWYVFLYQPGAVQLSQLQRQVEEARTQVKNANHAQVDLSNIQKRLENEKQEVIALKKRFADRNNLSEVTIAMQNEARRFHLELTDFAPVLETYFADTTTSEVKALPLAITVSGSYINIGRYIESWGSLPFYVVPEEIVVEKVDENSNELQAVVTGKLYCWKN